MENQKTDIDNSEKDNNPKRVVSGVNKKKRRVKRSVYWISALLFIFLVVIPLVVNFFADRIFGETMREIVRIESNGKYDFTYSKISFNLFKRKLRVLDFVLLPEKQSAGDTITMFPSDNEFDFKIPEFYIHGAGILSAITRGELIVGKIFFNEPHLHLNSTRIEPEDEKEPQKVQFSHHTVYPHIEGYLSLLRVDDFEIKNGTVSFHQVLDDSSEMVEINNISINVSGFHLDSIAHQNLERFFFSDSLSINFSGSDFMLEKNNHAISFRELNISSKNKTFEIGNFSVKFMDSANSAELKSWVDIDVPKLKFTGIDLNKSLQRNLYLDKIICQSPSVVYHAYPGHAKPFDREKISGQIFTEVVKLFEPVEINNITVEHANVMVRDLSNENKPLFHLPDLSVEVYHILVDSSSYPSRSKQFFIDDVSVILSNQKFLFNSSKQLLSLDAMSFDTRNSQFRVNNFDMTHVDNDLQRVEFDVSAREILIQGNDFINDYLTQSLNLKSCIFQQPVFKIGVNSDIPASQNTTDIYQLHNYLKPYLSGVTIDRFEVVDGYVNTILNDHSGRNRHINFDVAVDISDINICDDPSILKDKILYASDIEINLQDVLVEFPDNIHVLKAGEVLIATNNSRLDISDITIDTTLIGGGAFDPGHDKMLFNIDDISVSGIDFVRMYHEKQFDIRNFYINNPRGVYLLSNHSTQKQTKHFPDITGFRVENFYLNNADFQLRKADAATNTIDAKKAYLKLENLRPCDPGDRLPVAIDALLFDMGSFTYQFPDNQHALQVNKLFISSADSIIKAGETSFAPISFLHYSKGNIFDIQTDGFEITGLDIEKLYNKKSFIANKIEIFSPVSKVILSGSEKPKSDIKGLGMADAMKNHVLRIFDTLDVGDILLNKGTVEVFDGKTFNSRVFSMEPFNFIIHDLYIDPQVKDSGHNILYANNYQLVADGAMEVVFPKLGKVNFKDVYFSTGGKALRIKNIYATNKSLYRFSGEAQNSNYEVELSNVDLNGIEFYQLIANRKLIIDQVAVNSPDVFITQAGTSVSHHDLKKHSTSLNSIISKQLISLEVNNFEVKNARVKVKKTDEHANSGFAINRIDLKVKNFKVDSSNQAFGNKFLYTDDLALNLRDYSYHTKDSLYVMGAAGIGFNSTDMMLKVDSGYVEPQLDDTSFARRVGVQTDRFDLVFDSLVVDNFRLTELLFNNKLWIDTLTVYQLKGDDYRNKSFPRPKNHFPKLPVTALYNMGLCLQLDVLKMKNSQFQYREFVEPALQPGRIWFTDIDLTGFNITNDSTIISGGHNLMRFNATGKIVGEAELNIYLDFDLASRNDNFSGSGGVKPFDITSMNPLLEHVAFVKVKQGYSNSLDFNFSANHVQSMGGMRFKYNDLSIRLIDKKTLQADGFGESIASFLANTIVVRSKNPKGLFKRFRTGYILFERDTTKSFFNFYAKSFLSGVVSTIRRGNEIRKERNKKLRLRDKLIEEGKLSEGIEIPIENEYFSN